MKKYKKPANSFITPGRGGLCTVCIIIDSSKWSQEKEA
jgi:hypothetical protein